MNHYHIRWSSKKELDWESFGSRAEAEASAKELARPGETYEIEAADEVCGRCVAAMTLKTDHEDPKPKYPWQQAVADALRSPLEFLPLKVNAAERAISARLSEPIPANDAERMAIREALHSLQALLPDRSPKRSTENKLESGDAKQTA